jgi:preprotein translocase subunit SecG
MESIIIFIHVIAAIAITGLVLIQQGKGADMGASFGSGASQTVFGSSGSGNVLTTSTTIMAVVFFVTSLGLAIIAGQQASLSVEDSGLIENLDEISTQVSIPAGGDLPVFEEINLESDIPALVEEALEAADDIPVTGE